MPIDTVNRYRVERHKYGMLTSWLVLDTVERTDVVLRIRVDERTLTLDAPRFITTDGYLATAFAEGMRQASQYLLSIKHEHEHE